MKLNLGCGFDRREGWLNVDRFEGCAPDRLLDLEATPWDLPGDAFEHILLRHVLEHVGKDFAVLGEIMRELYRVAAPDGLIEVHVPHLRHDTFWTDPTHVRAFTPQTFQMFSKRLNRLWIERRVSATMLALMLDVDFEVQSVELVFDQRFAAQVEAGELTFDQLHELARERWNVAEELRVKMRAVKGSAVADADLRE
jgi:predicted SAM-dependent methyltransferase